MPMVQYRSSCNTSATACSVNRSACMSSLPCADGASWQSYPDRRGLPTQAVDGSRHAANDLALPCPMASPTHSDGTALKRWLWCFGAMHTGSASPVCSTAEAVTLVLCAHCMLLHAVTAQRPNPDPDTDPGLRAHRVARDDVGSLVREHGRELVVAVEQL